jgi:lysophospholipase L1-like esterase
MGVMGMMGLMLVPARAQTPGTAMALLPLRTASGLPSTRAITVSPQFTPLGQPPSLIWGASMVYYATNTVPGWGTNVAVMNLTPGVYTLAVQGVSGSVTLPIGTNDVGTTNWVTSLATNIVSVGYMAGVGGVVNTNSFAATTVTVGGAAGVTMLGTNGGFSIEDSSGDWADVYGGRFTGLGGGGGQGWDANAAFIGNGSGLSNLNATALGGGLVPSAALSTTTTSRTNVVVDGDSLSAGSGAPQWPTVLAGMARWAAATVTNFAISGSITTNVLYRWASSSAFGPTNNSSLCWYLVWIGHNDIDYMYEPFYLAVPNLATIWKQARDKGFKVGAFTIHQSVQMAGAKELSRNYLNTWIKQNSALYDTLIDIDAAFLGALGPNYYTNTSYFSDGIHPTTLGSAFVASNVDFYLPNSSTRASWNFPIAVNNIVSNATSKTPDVGFVFNPNNTNSSPAAWTLGAVGIGTNNPLGNLHIFADQNASSAINIHNPNTGANGATAVTFKNSSGYDSYLQYRSSGSTSLGPYQPNGLLLSGAGSGGLNLWASYSSAGLGVIRLCTGGQTVEKAVLDAAGNWTEAGTMSATNGFLLRQLPYIPTNGIPISTSLLTNYVFVNLTNTINGGGPMLVATNISAAGSFILLKPTFTQSTWP